MAEQYDVKAGDTLNSIAKKYGFSNYKEAGINSVPSGNFDLIRVGDKINIGAKAEAGAAPAPGSAPQGAPQDGAAEDPTALINADQDSEIEKNRNLDGPQLRESAQTTNDFFTSLTETINSSLGERPDTPSFSERYGQLRGAFSVSDLESEMNVLKQEERELQAVKRQRTGAQREKRVSQGVIAGRVGEVERQENERIDAVLRDQAFINDQLQTKYNVINTILGLEQTDYTNASQRYEQQYSQVVDTLNMARGLRSDELSERDAEVTSARANLQIMYNALSSGQADFDALDPAAIANITKLEVQSGLPVGFYQALKAKAGSDQMISSASRENNGQSYTDIIMQKADGSFYVETLFRGASMNEKSGGGSGSGDDSFEYNSSDERTLLGVGLSKERIEYLAQGVNDYGLDEVIAQENLTAAQETALRKVHGIDTEESKSLDDSKINSAATIISNALDKKAKKDDTIFRYEPNVRKEQLDKLVTSIRAGGASKTLKDVFGTDEVSDADRERLIEALQNN